MSRICALALLVTLIGGCGSAPSSHSQSDRTRGVGLSAPIKRVTIAEASAIRPRRERGAHVMGAQSCSPARGDVAIVDLLSADLPPSCTQLAPGDLLLIVNRTGAYHRIDQQALRVEVGRYSAQLKPEQAALFARPVSSYLRLGLHRIRAGHGAGTPAILILRGDCQVARGHIPNDCFRE